MLLACFSLHFHHFEPYLKLTSSKIVSIQRDTYNQGLLLVADRSAVWNVNLTTHRNTLLYGTEQPPATSVDGSTNTARFTHIVDMLQPTRNKLYVVQESCLRIINRESSTAGTLTGNCNEAGSTIGSLVNAAYKDIISAVLMTETKIVIAERNAASRLLLINLGTETVELLALIDKMTNIFLDPDLKTLLVFNEHGFRNFLLTPPSAMFIGRNGYLHANDGVLAEASFNYVTDAFYFDDIIIAIDAKDHVLRVFDTAANTVSSICEATPLGTQKEDLVTQPNSISECNLNEIYSATILPEHGLIVLGNELGSLIKLHVSATSKSKLVTITCTKQ